MFRYLKGSNVFEVTAFKISRAESLTIKRIMGIYPLTIAHFVAIYPWNNLRHLSFLNPAGCRQLLVAWWLSG